MHGLHAPILPQKPMTATRAEIRDTQKFEDGTKAKVVAALDAFAKQFA